MQRSRDFASIDARKSVLNSTIIIPTPHVVLTSEVPTETGSAAVNAVVPKPVKYVVPKTVTCVPQRKQIFVSRLNPDFSFLDITACIPNKVQIDDLKDERFNFPYAREVCSFCHYVLSQFLACWHLEVGNPFKGIYNFLCP